MNTDVVTELLLNGDGRTTYEQALRKAADAANAFAKPKTQPSGRLVRRPVPMLTARVRELMGR